MKFNSLDKILYSILLQKENVYIYDNTDINGFNPFDIIASIEKMKSLGITGYKDGNLYRATSFEFYAFKFRNAILSRSKKCKQYSLTTEPFKDQHQN